MCDILILQKGEITMANKMSITGKVWTARDFRFKGDSYTQLGLAIESLRDDAVFNLHVVVYAGDWREEGVDQERYATFDGSIEWFDFGDGEKTPALFSMNWKEGF